MAEKVEINRAVLMDALQFLGVLADVAAEAIPKAEARLDCGPGFYLDLMARLAEAIQPGGQEEEGRK